MLSEYQVQKLRRDMESELNPHPARLIGCLAGLVIIVVLAAAGPQIGPGTDAATSVHATQLEASVSRPAVVDQSAPADPAGGAVETHAQVVHQSVDVTGEPDSPR
jgi:hypothetical protein